MTRGTTLLVLFALTVVGQALTPTTVLTTVDQARLKAVFENARPFTDLASAHYSILGLKLLGAQIPNTHMVKIEGECCQYERVEDNCNYVKSAVDYKSPESLYYASAATKALGNCQLSNSNAQNTLQAAIKDGVDVPTLFFVVSALTNLGLPVNSNEVVNALTEALKTDDSILSGSMALHIAAQLSKETDVKVIFESIEDLVAQADEVGEKYLQFEGDLGLTSFFVVGAYRLAGQQNKAPLIMEDQAVKFANYLLSRKHVQSPKNAYDVAAGLSTLGNNKYHIPVCITRESSMTVSSAQSKVQVRVSNVMSGALGKLTVKADSAERKEDGAVVLSNSALTAVAKDNTLYELDFLKTKAGRGFYTIEFSVAADKPDSRLIGLSGAQVEVKVVTTVNVEEVELSLEDKDQSTPPRVTKVQYPQKTGSNLAGDHHQNLVMKFLLKDKADNSAMEAHQAFVRLTNKRTKQEVIFVAEADDDHVYKFELDIGASAKEHFNSLSGLYAMDLVVGDALIQNPFAWNVADLQLKFPEDSATSEEKPNLYQPREEIKHMFREPEVRPPATVSTAFTGLVLLPVLILLGLWIKLGVNIANFPLSLSAIGFHIGLGSILVLYYLFFVQLNMFDTLKYLAILGTLTFLAGNRLLGSIANKRKQLLRSRLR
ncbi:dolichyl-diphosphooligosaccharide--protein glycosyltransferase subunit 2-like isoform X2 [Branchiostoma floridae]|uniref:Dolichyl-diphosphooligosaccharide--protein glycosyltransferase subunit 2 n=1 Tax=Branchiostoma floridae TaxID=7739 RepID=A0A9J7HGV8_BRAFL|nr:dolichyl-diphosphooligosaccharide--protein glycosyltransferase subunit 2-like isoform X1 [Branchiostoma floridae]XP_035659118.1 dolichyl-diphosphooligosaccharide--protein glycosyltransferase subunit 2-like isoform X2 [Branchiostoma floridae]